MILCSGSPSFVPRDGGLRDAQGLITVRGGDAFRSRGEEVCAALPGDREQTFLRDLVRLDPAVA